MKFDQTRSHTPVCIEWQIYFIVKNRKAHDRAACWCGKLECSRMPRAIELSRHQVDSWMKVLIESVNSVRTDSPKVFCVWPLFVVSLRSWQQINFRVSEPYVIISFLHTSCEHRRVNILIRSQVTNNKVNLTGIIDNDASLGRWDILWKWTNNVEVQNYA